MSKNINANKSSNFTLPFTATVKSRGGHGTANGERATYNANLKRLNLGKHWYNLGYRSACVGLNADGDVMVHCRKQPFDSVYGFIHSDHGFTPVMKHADAVHAKLASSYGWNVSAGEPDDNGIMLTLTPNPSIKRPAGKKH